MNDQMNHGKGFLKEKLGGYQVDPPASVWSSISAGLGGRNRKGMIIISLAAAASVALAVTLGINYFGPDVPRDQVMAESENRPVEAVPESVPQVEEHPAAAVPESPRTAQRENLEEKVVRTVHEVSAGDDQGEEALPFDISTPSISEVVNSAGAEIPGSEPSGQDSRVEETRLTTSAEEAEEPDQNSGDEKAEDLTLDAGDEKAEDLTLDAGDDLADEGLMDFEETPGKDPRWIIGAALSPLYTFRDAEPQALAASPDHESGMVSYAGGIQVAYRTTRRLAIESGIFFNKMGIAIGAPGIQLFQPEYDFAPIGAEAARSNVMAISNTVGNIVSKSGDIYVNNYMLSASYDNTVPDQFSSAVNADQGIRQHLDYLEVPLNLRYTVVDRSLEVQLVGGMSTNLLINNYVTMETADGTTEIGYLTNIRTVNYSGNAGIGLVYHLMDHFSLSLEPRFRYFLNSVNDDSLPSTRPYTFGLYTGLNYRF